MITSKEEYRRYIELDEKARFGKSGVSWIEKAKKGKLWSYNVCLRKLEYYLSRKDLIGKVLSKLYRIKLNSLSIKTGWTIPPNVAGPGLLVVHRGTVVISHKARIGENCRIHVCVNIGAWKGEAPILGDNVYVGPGAKLYGAINIASNIAIGANSVVNKSFEEVGISIAGAPAYKISSNGSPYTSIGDY